MSRSAASVCATGEMAGATEDLMLMTKEKSGTLTAELADAATDRDRLHSKVQELMSRLHTTDQPCP